MSIEEKEVKKTPIRIEFVFLLLLFVHIMLSAFVGSTNNWLLLFLEYSHTLQLSDRNWIGCCSCLKCVIDTCTDTYVIFPHSHNGNFWMSVLLSLSLSLTLNMAQPPFSRYQINIFVWMKLGKKCVAGKKKRWRRVPQQREIKTVNLARAFFLSRVNVCACSKLLKDSWSQKRIIRSDRKQWKQKIIPFQRNCLFSEFHT